MTERPLIPGSIVGLRRFIAHEDGTLTGPVFEAPWGPGVNDAECYPPHATMARYIAGAGWPRSFASPLRHQIAGKDCSCGFYAVMHSLEGVPTYSDIRPMIVGIIEGWGVVSAYSLGFRAEHARILALIDPTDQQVVKIVREPSRWERFCLWLDRKPPRAIATLFSVLWVGGIALTPYVWPWPSYLLSLLAATLLLAASRGIRLSRLIMAREPISFDTERVELIKARYPDVAWFPSVEAALAEFPLSSFSDLPTEEVDHED